MMSSRSSNQLQLHEFTLVVPLQLIIYHIRCAFFQVRNPAFSTCVLDLFLRLVVCVIGRLTLLEAGNKRFP